MRAICLFLAVLALPAAAAARSDSEFAYPYARAWTAAVRLLRIDMGCPITEKDRDEGYFFFDYTSTSGSSSVPGSVEIVRSKVNGVDGVKVIVQIPAMPRYVEKVVLKKLGRKLKTEFGEPLSPAPVKPAPVPVEKEENDENEQKDGEKESKQAPTEQKEEPDKK